ncbi:amino acid adenylation domain-containing protein [Actinomadura sp. 6K520]|nr:amino acid adenylation domain-containing protein [Actinomadura sp. 6K520]
MFGDSLASTFRQRTPHMSSAHLFREVALAVAHRPAVRHLATLLTYEELAEAAGGVAAWLRSRGVERGGIVATLLDRSPWCAAASLGAWAAGAAYVHLDPADPDERIASLLANLRPDAVLTDLRNWQRLSMDRSSSLLLDQARPAARYTVTPRADLDDLAYLVHTSGSTGVPKIVEVQHRALLNQRDAFWRFVEPLTADSFGLATTFAADLSLHSVCGALLSGARLDIYDTHVVLDAVALAAELREYPVDHLNYTPSLVEALAAQHDLVELLPDQMLFVGGEPFPPRLVTALLRAAPDLAVFNAYGPSEATIEMMMHRVTPGDASRSRVPVGTPLDGTEARLLDSERKPVPPGTAGELHIGGLCLAKGYRGNPKATADRFWVAADGTRLYATGDLMVRDENGSHEFLRRVDRQLKIRGHRVEPNEVETHLLALPRVRQALVTGERTGDDAGLDLVGYFVADPPVEAGDVRRALSLTLPPSMVPGRLHAVAAIPTTTNGKADLAALRTMVADRAGPATVTDPPRSENEVMVANVWRSVLGDQELSRSARFMEIGGDSLKALRVFALLRRHHPQLTIGTLFEHPTIAELATALERSQAASREEHTTDGDVAAKVVQL